MKENNEIIYKITNDNMERGFIVSKNVSLTCTLSYLLANSDKFYEILEDMYLDYINYKKEIENNNLKNFIEPFKYQIKEINGEFNLNNIEKRLKSPYRENLIRILCSCRLVKEYNLIEGFEKYLKLKKIKDI